MGEALLWLQEEAPGAPDLPERIYYDSQYAHHAITGTAQPDANEVLIGNVREILSKVRVMRAIDFIHVKAHTGVAGNEFADQLADQGARGLQTTTSRRWLTPCDTPEEVPAIMSDHCWRCGKVYTGSSHARSLAGHEAYCKVPGAPPPFIRCRHGCGKQFAWKFAEGKRKQPHHARENRKHS